MEDSWKYYSSVVAESPGVWAYSNTSVNGAVGSAWATRLQCGPPNQIDCLLKLDSTEVLNLEALIIPWTPSVDHQLIKNTPLLLLKQGRYNTDVPAIIGIGKQEGNILAFIFLNGTMDISDSMYDMYLTQLYGPLTPMVQKWYADLKEQNGNFAAFSQVYGDYFISCGTYFAAEYLSSKSKTYGYQFSHPPEKWPLSFLNGTHTVELPFVFDSLILQGLPYLTPQEEILSLQMISMWTALLVNGNPSTSGIDWPEYDLTQQVLDLNIPLGLSSWDLPFCDHWLPYLQASV